MDEPDLSYVDLCAALKRVFKTKKLAYRDVAAKIGVAESSIKRILTAKDGSVGRLNQLCEVAGVRLRDLVTEADQHQVPAYVLSEAEEDFFLEHPGHWFFFTELYVARRSPAAIAAQHGLDGFSLRRYLEQLETLGLLERAKGGGVLFRVRGPLAFAEGSALYRRLALDLSRRILDRVENRRGDGSFHQALEVAATRSTHQRFIEELRGLLKRFYETAGHDQRAREPCELEPMALCFARTDISEALAVIPRLKKSKR